MYGFSGLYGRAYGADLPTDRPASTGLVEQVRASLKWEELQLSDKDKRRVMDVLADIRDYLGSRSIELWTLYANMNADERARWDLVGGDVASKIGAMWSAARRMKPAFDWRKANAQVARETPEDAPPPPIEESGTSPWAIVAGLVGVVALVGGGIALYRRGT